MANQAKLDEAYMECAYVMAKLSHAKRKQVGAILVSPGGGIIAEGVNGTYSGADNICEFIDLKEEWRPTEFENYLVSNFGQVKRLAYSKIHKKKSKLNKPYEQSVQYKEKISPIRLSKKGYPTVKINTTYIVIHRLVAKSFIDNPDQNRYNQVNHIDHNKENNRITNLEWCTNIYNCCDRSQKLRNDDLPSNITLNVKGKFKYQVQYLKNGKKKSRRCVTLEEAKAAREEFIDPKDYLTYRYNITIKDISTKPECLHAESNAIAKVARSTNSSVGSTLYCVLSPCFECAKLIIQAGIKRIVYSEIYRSYEDDPHTAGIKLVQKAGIRVDALTHVRHNVVDAKL